MMRMLFATIVSVGFLSYANAGETCADCGSSGACEAGQSCCEFTSGTTTTICIGGTICDDTEGGNVLDGPCTAAGGDPHFGGADGDRFDFKGRDKLTYNLMSTQNLTVNAHFEHKDYRDAGEKHRLVHGSYMTEGYVVAHTAGDRTLNIEYDAVRAAFVKIGVNGSGTEPTAYKAPFSMTVDDLSLSFEKGVVELKTLEWTIRLSSKMKPGMVSAGSTCAGGKCFLEAKMSPLVNVATLKVAPHGLIGQTYDGDGIGVIGKTDDYKTHDNAATTSAMGEGAIEGVAADYEMASKFATHFKYSRYGLTQAKPRDISKLVGEKKRLSGNADAGAA